MEPDFVEGRSNHGSQYGLCKYRNNIYPSCNNGNKATIPVERAYSILTSMVNEGKLDAKLVGYLRGFIDELLNVPDYINAAFQKENFVKQYSNYLVNYENAAILASGMFYPLAKEGALKIKETAYINTTAYPTGEFLHGHIAILNKRCAVISLVNHHNVQFTIDVLNKINCTYKTDTLIITAIPLSQLNLSNIIYLPSNSDINFIFSSLVIFQLLAYNSALQLCRNIDNPDGLQKIVK